MRSLNFAKNNTGKRSKAMIFFNKNFIYSVAILLLVGSIIIISQSKVLSSGDNVFRKNKGATIPMAVAPKENLWAAVSLDSIKDEKLLAKATYGMELIANTSKYLGPKGTVKQISNGMNCQNCHLNAGTKEWGNNYGSVYSQYPKFRARSGSVENLYKRVNDCIERSLNGKGLDTNSYEMQSIITYINYIGSNVKKGEKAMGSGFKDLAFLNIASNPLKGKTIYIAKCASCHSANGAGMQNEDKSGYTFPPLWGKNSYNDGAGLYRLSNFAKYVKYNMPLGVNHDTPQLTDAEAWHLAAFVNSQPHPHKNVPNDWPDVSKKPIDHPFGPYSDSFTEKQHKFGPFKPIKDAQDAVSKKVK